MDTFSNKAYILVWNLFLVMSDSVSKFGTFPMLYQRIIVGAFALLSFNTQQYQVILKLLTFCL